MSFLHIYIFSFFLILNECANVPDGDARKGEGKPLFLSEYIKTGRIEEARRLAQVEPFLDRVTSYSGLLTVDEKYDSNLFFWYFPSERRAARVPLLVWLNGFSTASTYGVFLQTGPYDLINKKLKRRGATSWQRYYNVVYFDSPVGVGYSFSNSTEGYSTDLDRVSENLEKALVQFLQVFPELQSRELYLTGLSLAGKYVSSFAHKLFKKESFNLKGIFLGNPLLDIEKQLNYENYLYELGFIGKDQRSDLVRRQDVVKRELKDKNYAKFYKEALDFLLGEKNFIVNITGLNNVYDYEDNVIDPKYYTDFIQKDEVKRALHVGGIGYDDGTKAMSLFERGLAFSALPYLREMAQTVGMMFYAGQTDVSCAYPMMVDALSSMEWSGREGYTAAPRRMLYNEDGTRVWGYLRTYKTLSDVMVRKAGHSAVTSQPTRVLWLLHNFTDYTRFL